MGVEAVTATAKATPVKAAVLTVLSDPETRFAVEMARLHARGDLEAAIGRVKAATGGREAASALSSQLKRVDGTVVPYVTRTEAKAALNTGVSFERAEVERRRYVRGDINDDLRVDVSDAVRLLLHLFAGRVAACPAAGDSNGDSEVDVSDVAYLLNHLFRGGPPVPPPFPGCGVVPPGQSCDAHACSAV